jgi:PPOX class probable FMN-dependent enzyme
MEEGLPSQEQEDYLIRDLAALEALYGPPVRTARQESDHLHEAFRDFVQRSPFLVIATHGPQRVDASAKGDPGGFVQVPDEKTLLIPERGANGRNDSLRNIVCNPQVALTFFVPGNADLLRVSGKAHISIAPDLQARFPAPKPRAVIVVTVEECFVQCSRAIQRSDLWSGKSV